MTRRSNKQQYKELEHSSTKVCGDVVINKLKMFKCQKSPTERRATLSWTGSSSDESSKDQYSFLMGFRSNCSSTNGRPRILGASPQEDDETKGGPPGSFLDCVLFQHFAPLPPKQSIATAKIIAKTTTTKTTKATTAVTTMESPKKATGLPPRPPSPSTSQSSSRPPRPPSPSTAMSRNHHLQQEQQQQQQQQPPSLSLSLPPLSVQQQTQHKEIVQMDAFVVHELEKRHVQGSTRRDGGSGPSKENQQNNSMSHHSSTLGDSNRATRTVPVEEDWDGRFSTLLNVDVTVGDNDEEDEGNIVETEHHQQQHQRRQSHLDAQVLQSLHKIERTRRNSDSIEKDEFRDESNGNGSDDPFDIEFSGHKRSHRTSGEEKNKCPRRQQQQQGSTHENKFGSDDVLASLKQETETYRAEAVALREEIEQIKNQLAEFRQQFSGTPPQSSENEQGKRAHSEKRRDLEGVVGRVARHGLVKVGKKEGKSNGNAQQRTFDFAAYAKAYYTRDDIQENIAHGKQLPMCAQSPRSLQAIQNANARRGLTDSFTMSVELDRKYRREWARNEAIERAESSSPLHSLT